ncbi:MAG: hypothetical protein KJ666_14750 [Bacteroidetes bacterium]|nr:hypothetical protein [Bacteroidota bacterium]MBU2585105.1 hypothetical protein [Bacteroidota bacterium]
MEILLSILQAVLFVVLILFILYLTYLLRGVAKSVKAIEIDVGEISQKAKPVLENLESLTSRINNISSTIEEQVATVKDAVGLVKETFDDVERIKNKVRSAIEDPIDEFLSTRNAIIKGVRVFWQTLRDYSKKV